MKTNLIKTLLTAFLLIVVNVAVAGPALKVKRTITLVDGTQKVVTLCGDENMHFYVDEDNNTYTVDAEGRYVKSDRRNIHQIWQKRMFERNQHRIERAKKIGLIPKNGDLSPRALAAHKAKWGATSNPISGKKKGLVILVNFKDKAFNIAHGHDFYDGYFNKVGFSEAEAKGSVHDYFLESSYGKFDLTFDVIGPVTVSKNMSYYGQNMQGADMYPATMVSEACKLADLQGVDFSKYDWDGDGMVDQVYVLYAGYGESMGGAENTIWPHESNLSGSQAFGDGNGALTLDGVKIDTYAVSCELLGSQGSMAAGIGTACHEFSHCMCIPDMYDINSQYFGMYAWDIMDFGSYGGEYYGECPTPYTAYERMYCGWLTPTVLDSPCIVANMKCIHDEPEAYIIYNEKDNNEYYMLENRQQKGFSKYDPAHGLLITHIYFDPASWTDNTVNSTSLQRMTVIPADNTLTEQTLSGDTWPGTSGNTALTDSSKPAATLYATNADGSKLMGKPIEEIEESNGLIGFIFNGGVMLPIPVVQPDCEVTDNGFTAKWETAVGATEYEVELTSSDLNPQKYGIADVALMIEDFHGFNNGSTANGKVDLGTRMDTYTTIPGWEGVGIYTTPRDEIRIGNQNSGGHIYSPWLVSETKNITISFTVRSYGSDTEPLYLIMGDEEGAGYVGKIELSKEAEQYVLNGEVDSSDWWFGLSCDARCYVSEMSAYDGILSVEDLESGYVTTQITEKEMVKTIATSYSFSNLSADKKYSYRVRALSGNARSKWSEPVEVVLGASTGIVAMPNAVDNHNYGIYDFTGRKLYSVTKSGMYIIDGKKIIKK